MIMIIFNSYPRENRIMKNKPEYWEMEVWRTLRQRDIFHWRCAHSAICTMWLLFGPFHASG